MGRSKRTRRLPLIAAVAVVAAMVLSACTPGGAGPTTSSAPARTLTIGATAEPPTMDPMAVPAAAGSQVMLYNVYETLVKTDAEGDLQPLLAQRWEVSSDRRTYTFVLNRAARFADGTPVTAQAVVDNIMRIKDPKVAAKSGTVVAAKLVQQMAIVSSAQAVDEGTLRVTLSRPSNGWLYDMSSTAGMVANPAGFRDLASASAGSGPFALDRWARGTSVALKRNQAYWGTPARFDEVTFRYYTDPTAMTAAMMSGQLDIISNLQAPDAIGQFEDPARFKVIEGTTNGEVVLGLNNATPALKNIKVRQAIASAIDKKALLDTVWNGKGRVIGSMAVPTDPYFEDLSGVNAYNPTRAKQLLKEAGYAGGLTLRLKPAALPYATRAAQFVASQLREVGVTVTIEELQFPNRWSDVVYGKADYDMSIVAHVEARDLGTYTNPNYYWRYNNATFTKLYLEADQAAPDQYVPDMKRVARYLADDAAGVWLFVLPNLVVTKPNITGISQNAPTLSFDVTTIAAG
ncbi:ABC transporter substrate-binding protein [Nigerium massiliense]|uniref:ABC transporter substrate-binding protein n=1 Tax=Nigerium massiliense TaxID=1522317 RepID=UPI000693F9F5|nr:ABC transporter substrate-binding protein [Nigerium massiliense]